VIAGEQVDMLKPAAPAEPPASIFDLLRRRHPPGEWAFMEEVAPATGGGTRYADAIAVNLWRSRGHAIHGFEVKVSRSDWLRELKQPDKAEPLFRYCDYWFLVAEKDIVKPGELPDSWGHMERRGNSLHIVKPAPKQEAQPLTRAFFASLMRRGHEQLEALAARSYSDKIAEVRKDNERHVAEAVDRAMRNNKSLQAQVDQFVAATGIPFDQYSPPPMRLIKLAQRLEALQGFGYGDGDGFKRLTDLANELQRAAETVRTAVDAAGMGEAPAPT
jgi:hypothetical protein